MGTEMDPNQLNLLIKLRTLLKNPGIPALLDRLSQSESLPIYTEPVPHPIPTSPTPTLLRRMEDSRPLTISRESLNLLGEENPLKRKQSPPLFGYSERTLISRLHNPKKKRHLTPISRKSSPSSLHSMNPEYHRATNPRQTLLSRLETGENMMTSSLTLNPTADILLNLKRLKLIESEMPWFVPEGQTSGNSSCASCQETCRLLRAYNRDISKAKFLVKITPNSPNGIPSSQWERILKGEAIDLNQFFASLHHVVPDEERTGRLGDTEITFGVSEPKKRISTAAEWSSSWRRASKAISFAFPHRREELLEYGDYIESEFTAKIVSSHHKLLLYDIALRNEVAAGQQTLLTDFHKFSRLYSAIVLPDGVESGGFERERQPGRRPRSQKGDKSEICNKFNAGTCKNLATDCKYRHLCKSCGKSDHGKRDCSDGNK